MLIPARFAILVLLVSTPAFSSPGPANAPSSTAEVTTPEEQAQFDLIKKRRLERLGIPAEAATTIVAPTAVQVKPSEAWLAEENERATKFNLEFGSRAYEGIIGFFDRCKTEDGCNRFATASLIQGAYKFVDLRQDVEKNVVSPESDAYRARHRDIKGGMRSTMEEFRLRKSGRTEYEREFIKFSDPIVTKIFSPEEMQKYAERNAADADSATMYNNLGRTLNGRAPPARAEAAFDAALKRDPKNADAFAGRAEARFNKGDYPGAASDARAALKLNPSHDRAYATLKFSEGRIRAGDSGGPEVAGGRAIDSPTDRASVPSGAAAAAAAGYAPASPGGAPGASGVAPPSFDAARRSGTFVSDARRALSLGDYQAAAAALAKAAEINPGSPEVRALAAMTQIQLKNFPEALAAAEAGLALAPNNATLLVAKATALNNMKDYKGALAAADLALAADPRNAVAHYNRAWALNGLGDRAGSLASLRSAADLNPQQFAEKYEAAYALPLTSDIMYLFPGGTAAEQPKPSPEAPAAPPSWILPAAAGAGFLGLVALLLSLRRRKVPPAFEPSRKAPALLDGKFEVGRQIGSGGMGVVYEGRDRSLDRRVAIKRMREEIRYDVKERARFIAEAQLVAKLKHPHIVEIHTIVEQDGEVYLIFEHIAGKTLDQVIEAERAIPFERARDLFRGVAAALDFAHGRGVIHRDLKPANLMLDSAGRVRVMDFGIARLTEDAISRRTGISSAVGTPLYMAPEQEQAVAIKESDAYSMALCLYEALTGRRPFAGTGAGLLMNKLKSVYDPPSRVNPRLPPGIDEVFAKALHPEPSKRYSSAGNLLRALEALETPRP